MLTPLERQSPWEFPTGFSFLIIVVELKAAALAKDVL
jgi:hypothetical protein